MESNLLARRQGLEEKIPDIKKTLQMVEFLQERRVRLALALLLSGKVEHETRKARARRRMRTMKI